MAASAANIRVKKESLISALEELDIAAKDVLSYSKDILAAEQLRHEINALKLQLANRDEEISREKDKARSLSFL
jgi:hypothetical protein